MSDYISREDVFTENCDNMCGELKDTCTGQEDCSFYQAIANLLAADVAPVVHSRWEYKCGEVRCPECGNRIHRIDLSGYLNFCPNCGAKMDGKE